MGRRRWIVTPVNKDTASHLAEQCGIDPFLALLLVTRGIIEPDEAEEFLSGGIQEDPFCFADMDAAVGRIHAAVGSGEKIAVYGDYDADGVTATALLYSYLIEIGADAVYYIPDREKEGYGLSQAGIDALAAQSVSLIVTVDNGISAADEVDYARQLNIDVVVTDHHQPPARLPDAIAVVNPHRADCISEFKDYAGVGVAYKLVCAMEGDADSVLERYGDLIALGTLADVVPLKGENRFLTREGLRMINERARPGITALREVSGSADKPVTATSALFTMVPRINAAGRMDSPLPAVQLLLCDNSSEAERCAAIIHQHNIDRQTAEAEIIAGARLLLEERRELLLDRVLVVDGEGWNPGVIGIIASRISEKYAKPCIVFSHTGGAAKGSGRSIKGFNLYNAVKSCEDILDRFGGHELAVGVGLPAGRIAEFRRRINLYAADVCPEMPFPETAVDFKLSPAQLSIEIIAFAEMLEPFGAGNPRPVFGLFNMRLDGITPVGGGRHLRLAVSRDGTKLNVMYFGCTTERFPYVSGQTVDLAVFIERNEYRGTVSVSPMLKDIRSAGMDHDGILSAYRQYDSVMRGDPLTPEQKAEWRPRRDELERLYRYLRSNGWDGPAEQLSLLLDSPEIPFIRILLSLELLRQAGLIELNDFGDRHTAKLLPATGKVDLEQTNVMIMLGN